MKRPRGRPPRAQAPVSRDEMVVAALELLDREGADALTMRALAERLAINPMTIHRDGLIGAMSDAVYAQVMAREDGTPIDRIGDLLIAYHAQVLRHPALTTLIFSRPIVFPQQAERITNEISTLLAEVGLPDHRTEAMTTPGRFGLTAGIGGRTAQRQHEPSHATAVNIRKAPPVSTGGAIFLGAFSKRERSWEWLWLIRPLAIARYCQRAAVWRRSLHNCTKS